MIANIISKFGLPASSKIPERYCVWLYEKTPKSIALKAFNSLTHHEVEGWGILMNTNEKTKNLSLYLSPIVKFLPRITSTLCIQNFKISGKALILFLLSITTCESIEISYWKIGPPPRQISAKTKGQIEFLAIFQWKDFDDCKYEFGSEAWIQFLNFFKKSGLAEGTKKLALKPVEKKDRCRMVLEQQGLERFYDNIEADF